VSDSRFELMEELVTLNLVEVKVICLFSIQLNAIIKLFTKVLASAFLELSQPQLNILNSLVNDVLQCTLSAHQVVDRAH
jgi:hypothetical protein